MYLQGASNTSSENLNMDNILFLSENLVLESHTGELIEGLKRYSNNIIPVNYFDSFGTAKLI